MDNRIGQLFLRVACTACRCTKGCLGCLGYLVRDVNNFMCLILHGQIERANLHDRIDVFVKDISKLFPAIS